MFSWAQMFQHLVRGGEPVCGDCDTFKKWGMTRESGSLEGSGEAGFMVHPSCLMPRWSLCLLTIAKVWHTPISSLSQCGIFFTIKVETSSTSLTQFYQAWSSIVEKIGANAHPSRRMCFYCCHGSNLSSQRAWTWGTLMYSQTVVYKAQVQKQ